MKVRPLPKSLQDKANTELNEVSSQLKDALDHLKHWIEKQDHLKCSTDEQLLLNFLRGSKFSLERAKEKIDAYYSLRTLAPEIAQNFDPLEPIQHKILKLGLGVIPMPISKEDPAEARVVLMRHPDFDPNEISLQQLVKSTVMSCNVLFNECDNYVVSGVKLIWDMENMKLVTALQATPDLIKKLVLSYETAFPVRIKAVYFVNTPKFFKHALKIIKLLLSEKLASRVNHCSTEKADPIFKRIPKSSLPYEYGGNAGNIEDIKENWIKVIERHRQRLIDEKNYYSDESKRSSHSSKLSNIFGVEGSFRKLEID